MLRRFLRDSAVYAVSAGLSRGIGILLLPLYTRFLQSAEYGALDVLTVVGTLANYVIALEISQGVARLYADSKRIEDKDAYVSTAWWFAALAYALFVVLVVPFSEAIAEAILDSAQWRNAVMAMALAISMNGMFFLMQDLMKWQLRPMAHALGSIVYTCVGTAVGAGLVVFAAAGVPGILYGQCAGALAGIVVACAAGAAKHWKPVFSRVAWRDMVAYSGPQVLSSVAAYVSLYVDRLLIKQFMSLHDVGTYGVGARIASVVTLIMMGFQSGLVPLVFQNYKSPDTPGQLARVFGYFLVFAGAMLFFLCTFSKELVWIFATPEYFATWQVIPLLAAALLLASMYIFVPGIFLARRTGIVAAISVTAAIVSVLANVVLIPRFGILGAGMASLLASAVAFATYLHFNQIYYPLALNWKRLVALTAFIASAGGGLMMLQAGLAPANILVLRLLLWLAACIGCAWIILDRTELSLAVKGLLKKPE